MAVAPGGTGALRPDAGDPNGVEARAARRLGPFEDTAAPAGERAAIGARAPGRVSRAPDRRRRKEAARAPSLHLGHDPRAAALGLHDRIAQPDAFPADEGG